MAHSQSPENRETPLSIDFQSLRFLAAGQSGIVYVIDEERVLKEYYDGWIDIERRALARLSSHTNIVGYLGRTNNGCILERGISLRKTIQETGADLIPLDRKIRWLQEAAEGMRFMHNNGIIHADTGCHNMILVQGRLKIIDFEGCSIDGGEATSFYEWFSCQEPPANRKTDIFAYGCAIYEVITGRPPYEEFAEFGDRMHRVKQLYAENRFPEVEDLPLGNLMQGCWYGTLSSMGDILRELEAATLTLAGRVDASHTASDPQRVKSVQRPEIIGSMLRV